jgi:hypothetical protein
MRRAVCRTLRQRSAQARRSQGSNAPQVEVAVPRIQFNFINLVESVHCAPVSRNSIIGANSL